MDTGYEVFSQYYDGLTENVNYAERAAYFDGLIRRHKRSEGVVLLDLACGTGSMSEEMAGLGYDVIGVDFSYGMLSRAMEKKMESGLPIQYVCQDMREIELYGTVDAVICTLDSLNHLDSFADVETVFRKVAENLEPGGVFIFDMNTPYKHREVLGSQIYIYDTETVYCVWENRYEPEQHTVHIRLDFFEQTEDGSYFRSGEEITEHAYEPQQVAEALERAGLTVMGCYHADTEEPLRDDSQRMIFVTGKQED
ncbi:MAG: class I SAM-dependent methyltransferase [Ruminococcus sp.]|nr:class I SAM-dependent methyltransferase [Ruminococcus sp.]